MKIVTTEQMFKEDTEATSIYGIPALLLMENAATECIKIIENEFSFNNKKVLVVCGGGNNGGDGLAIARKLFIKEINVSVFKAFNETGLKEEGKINLDIVSKLGVPFSETLDGFDLIIECLLGIGIKGNVREKEKNIIEHINSLTVPVVSVDVPAGICANTGKVCGCAIKADLTIALGYGKPGLYTGKGYEYSGKVKVVDISLPPNNDGDLYYLDKIPDKWILNENPLAHKGNNGKVLIVAGSKGMTGAACFTALGAHKAGAGLVKLVTPENLNEIYEKKLTETITMPVNCRDYLDESCCDDIINSGYDAIIIGPGLGRNEQTVCLVHKLIRNARVPLIIDADGIYALSLNINILREAKSPVYLTPHQGELSRLTGISVENIENDRIGVCRSFVKEHNVTLLLKGAGTIIAEKEGNVYINSTGNEGMAKGGSGDILSGILGAFVAKNVPHSASFAAFIHGMAGDKAAEINGKCSMLPSDILEHIHLER